VPRGGIDATALGIRPSSAEDQTKALQRATDPNDLVGVGIGIEADAVVTGNVVENAPSIGIAAG
jgi:putative cofactor-binding repeat protein